MGYESKHFKRYINWEYFRNNYEDIIKTGFDFPRIFIYCIKHELYIENEKLNQILDTFYSIPKKEDDYYPILKLIEFCEKYSEFNDLLEPWALNYQNSVALIFSKIPNHWGLRGDPYFWTYLEDQFIKFPIPMDIKEFENIIRIIFHKISGGKRIGQRVYFKEFAHGGMSSGEVSGIWWDLIPLLKYRLILLNNDYYLNKEDFSKIIKNPQEVIKTKKRSVDEILEEYDKPLKKMWL